MTDIYVLPFTMLENDSIELFDTDGHKINNGVLRVVGVNPDAEVLTGYIHVKNNTKSELKIYAKRIINQQVDESANWFCFGTTCYGPMTDSSLTATILSPGAVNESFYGDYAPAGKGGLTSVTYEFYDKQTFGTRISARATVEFAISATGISSEKPQISISPNPVDKNAVIHYNLHTISDSKKLIIRNLQGLVVLEKILSSKDGTLHLDFSTFSPGIYSAVLIAADKVLLSQKIIVTH